MINMEVRTEEGALKHGINRHKKEHPLVRH